MAILIFLAFLVAAGLFSYFILKRVKTRSVLESLNLKLFLVRLPTLSREGKELKNEISISEQLFAALASFRKPFVFEVAVPYVGEEIHFYVAIHERFAEALERQIRSLWNDAQVEPVDDYNIFNDSGVTVGAWIKQSERFILPIRTYAEIGNDTFLPFLGGLTKINEIGEGGAFQYIIRPAPRALKKQIESALRSLKKGWRLKDIMRTTFSISWEDVEKAIITKNKAEESKEKIIDEAAVRALETKLAKPLFEVNIRVIASAPSKAKAESIFDGLVAGFSQFGSPERNELKVVRPRHLDNLVYQFTFREFNKDQAMVLSAEELASLFHLPTPFTEIPKIKGVKAKEAPPPANLPTEGAEIGESFYRSQLKKVYITDEDRRRHFYIIGQTGTGKSNLIINMASQDIKKGYGVGVIDPHGDLAEKVLSLIPPNRYDDVIYFDPADFSRPIGLNMLEYDFNKPEQKTFIVNEMVNIFDKLYDLKVTGGPMFEQYMRNALLLLMEDMPNEEATLMEVPRVFTDAEFRNRKLARIYNPTVLDFWQKEAIKVGGEASLTNVTPYITSKFNNFTANDYMRVIIGQSRSAFRFREVMDQGKVLIINLSKGRIGDINANLLGMIVVGKLLMAALSRVDLPEAERRDFYLYIDEFQNFTTDSIAIILAEARKYRLNLTVAHQFINQLTEKVRDAVFGNVGSLAAFRVGAQDAEFLVKQFAPVFNEHDLLNIDNTKAYVKLLIKGETAKPFNIQTRRAPVGDQTTAAQIKELSRLKYGRLREEVEGEIYKRLRE